MDIDDFPPRMGKSGDGSLMDRMECRCCWEDGKGEDRLLALLLVPSPPPLIRAALNAARSMTVSSSAA